MDVKGPKRSVKVWANNFYKNFFKNIVLYMNGQPSNICSLHTYVMHRMFYFEWYCTLDSLICSQLYIDMFISSNHTLIWDKKPEIQTGSNSYCFVDNFNNFKFFSVLIGACTTPYSVIKPPVIRSAGVTSKAGFQQAMSIKKVKK